MEPIKVQYIDGLRTRTEQPNGIGPIATHASSTPDEVLEAFTPMQLLANAAAACVLSTVGHAASVHGFSVEGCYAKASYTVHQRPTRLATLRIDLHMAHDQYDSKQKRFIAAAAESCAVTRSLAPDVEKEVNILYAE